MALNKQTRPHYETLNVDRGATAVEVKASWRALASALHPDRLGGTAEANAAFANVTEAYAVLSDVARRQAYDASLDLLSVPCAKCKGEGRTWKQKGFTGRVSAYCGHCGGTGRIQK